MEIAVAGARGAIGNIDAFLERVAAFQEDNCIAVQVMDASLVFGMVHLLSAANHAVRAFERAKNTASSLATELLVYASGERQISKAIELMGVKEATTGFAFVLVGDGAARKADQMILSLEFHRDDSVLGIEGKDASQFGISGQGQRVQDLILERVALLDLRK